MAIIGNQITSVPFTVDSFSGDNSEVRFGPLARVPYGTASIAVFIGGSYKTPVTDYTLDTDYIVFTSAPASGSDNIVILHLGIGYMSQQVPASGTVGDAQLQANSVTSRVISNSAVQANNILDGTITTDKIADGAITSDKIADGTVIAADIAANSVTTSELANDAVQANNILNATITGAKLVANTITAREIADNAVLSNTILNRAVTADKLANTAVTTGTYGGQTAIPVITIDQQGRITSASNTEIQAPLPNILMLSGM